MAEQRIGMVGLGVMGAGLAENIARNGYDGYRTAHLPANLLPVRRDYFAHTYEHIDRPRGTFFHTGWTAGEES